MATRSPSSLRVPFRIPILAKSVCVCVNSAVYPTCTTNGLAADGDFDAAPQQKQFPWPKLHPPPPGIGDIR